MAKPLGVLLFALCCLPALGQTHARSLEQAPSDCCARLAAIGFTSELPVVVLDSNGATIPHKVDTKIELCTCSNGAGFEDYEGLATAAGRGTSSANNTKKSYKLELEGADGKKNAAPFLGMPSDADWILYGPEPDMTLGIRNFLTYNLARASGRYGSRTVYCEVFLVDDGKPLNLEQYNGVYIAVEKMEINKDRVAIAKLDAAKDPSGGYLFLYDNDNIEAGDVTFGPLPKWDHPFVMKDPKDAPPAALSWLLNYLQGFQTALASPTWLADYPKLIDVPAAIDFFLLVELAKNPDGYRGSTYMTKEKGKSFAPGPVWDYDEAYGKCCGYPVTGWDANGVSGPGTSGGSAISPEGFRFNICADPGRCLVDPTDGLSVWYRRMWEDPTFRAQAAARWQELRAGPWSDAEIKKLINGPRAELANGPALRNYQKFSQILTKGGPVEEQWDAEVQDMLEWTLNRVAWLDGALAKAAAAPSVAAQSSG